MIHRLIGAISAVTRCRDRDNLDLAVARLAAAMVDSEGVTIYRLTANGQARCLERCVSLNRDGCVDNPTLDEEVDLAQLCDVTRWTEGSMRTDSAHWPINTSAVGGRRFSIFPVFGESELWRLVAIEFAADCLVMRSSDTRRIRDVLDIVGNHVSLLDYGERDTLTGLMNRRTLEVTFQSTRERARLASRDGDSPLPTWLGVVDVDRFKNVNDRFGHLFGDEVLLLVSRLMRENFRGADQLFRFGGEEFCIILDRSPDAGAGAAFERLRAAIELHPFPQIGRVTVSLGFTQIELVEAAASAFERADAALYFAKNHGRNQVQSYERLLAAGLVRPIVQASEVVLF